MDANTTIIHEDELIEDVSSLPICSDIVSKICKVNEVLQEINRQVYQLDDIVYCLKDCSNILRKKRQNLDVNRNTVQKLFELDTVRKDSEAVDNLPGLMEQLEGRILEGNQLIGEESVSIDTQSDVLVVAVDSLTAIAKDLTAFAQRISRSPGHSKIIKVINEISEQEDIVNSILSPLRPKSRSLSTLGNRNSNSNNNISSSTSSSYNQKSSNGGASSTMWSFFDVQGGQHGRNTRSRTGTVKPKTYTDDNDAEFDSGDEIEKAIQRSKIETRRDETVIYNSDESVAELRGRPQNSSHSNSKYAGNPSMAVLKMDQELMRAKQAAELQEQEVDVTQERPLFDLEKGAPITPWLSSRKSGSATKKIILSSQDEEGTFSQQDPHTEVLPLVDVCSPSTLAARTPIAVLNISSEKDMPSLGSAYTPSAVSNCGSQLYSTNTHHQGRVGGWDGGPDLSPLGQQQHELQSDQGSVYSANRSDLSVTDSSGSELETTTKKIPMKKTHTPAACRSNPSASGLSHSKSSKQDHSSVSKHSLNNNNDDEDDMYFSGTQTATPTSKIHKKETSELKRRSLRQGTGTQSENDEEDEGRNDVAVSRYSIDSSQNTPLVLPHNSERVEMSGGKRGSESLYENHEELSSSSSRVLRSPPKEHDHMATKKSKGDGKDIEHKLSSACSSEKTPLGHSSRKLDKIAQTSHFPSAAVTEKDTTTIVKDLTHVRSSSRNSNLAVQHQTVVDLTD